MLSSRILLRAASGVRRGLSAVGYRGEGLVLVMVQKMVCCYCVVAWLVEETASVVGTAAGAGQSVIDGRARSAVCKGVCLSDLLHVE